MCLKLWKQQQQEEIDHQGKTMADWIQEQIER
jgi:hypothetical protein